MEEKSQQEEYELRLKIEHYIQLQTNSRHYDNRLWLIPGSALTLNIVIFSAIGNSPLIGLKIVLSLINIIIFLGFLFLFLKDRSFQLEIQKQLTIFKENNPGIFGKYPEFSGQLSEDAKDRWFIRGFKHRSAANYMFYGMFFILICNIEVFFFFLFQGIKDLYF